MTDAELIEKILREDAAIEEQRMMEDAAYAEKLMLEELQASGHHVTDLSNFDFENYEDFDPYPHMKEDDVVYFKKWLACADSWKHNT
jgi:hypothetical protein